MVTNPDLKSGFQTDPNLDFTKNWDPDFKFKSGLKPVLRISNPV
jgi:hypothetical protein